MADAVLGRMACPDDDMMVTVVMGQVRRDEDGVNLVSTVPPHPSPSHTHVPGSSCCLLAHNTRFGFLSPCLSLPSALSPCLCTPSSCLLACLPLS